MLLQIVDDCEEDGVSMGTSAKKTTLMCEQEPVPADLKIDLGAEDDSETCHPDFDHVKYHELGCLDSFMCRFEVCTCV